jgi:hypothetical protein
MNARDASDSFDPSRFDEIQSFYFFNNRTEELHFPSTFWRGTTFFYLGQRIRASFRDRLIGSLEAPIHQRYRKVGGAGV